MDTGQAAASALSVSEDGLLEMAAAWSKTFQLLLLFVNSQAEAGIISVISLRKPSLYTNLFIKGIQLGMDNLDSITS